MKRKAFSLIEVLTALAIVALLVVLLSAALGGSFTQFRHINSRRARLTDAENLMEATLAGEAMTIEGLGVEISTYGEGLERVEVVDEKTGDTIFTALRPSEGFYTH